MIIAFSGVDCAGKSTQIELLRQHYVSLGKRVAVVWYRPGYSPELGRCKDVVRRVWGLAGAVRRRLRPSVEAGVHKNEAKPHGMRAPAPLWLITAMADSVFQYAVKLRLLARKYDVVICDRYAFDARLDIIFKYPEYFWSETVFKPLSLLFPRPDAQILLWLDFAQVCARAEAKQEPFPDDAHTRYLRWRAYDFMRDEEGVSVITSDGTVEETHRRILDCL